MSKVCQMCGDGIDVKYYHDISITDDENGMVLTTKLDMDMCLDCLESYIYESADPEWSHPHE